MPSKIISNTPLGLTLDLIIDQTSKTIRPEIISRVATHVRYPTLKHATSDMERHIQAEFWHDSYDQ